MRILILGGDGMLGHRLLRQLAPRHETRVTLRRSLEDYGDLRMFDRGNAFDGIDVRDTSAITRTVADFGPDAVVNAAGIVKQRKADANAALSVEVNGIFPHLLSRVCRDHGIRLVHLSTDCVFSGRKGNYSEDDRPDPVDVYGFSKLLGETAGQGVVTLRTSMIGPELRRKTGLLEWFLAQETGAVIAGWRKAIFSGFTTAALARLVEFLLTRHPQAAGLYHASATAISKHDLLVALNRRLARGVTIMPDESVACDRSLDSRRFRAEFGYVPPAWDAMLDELADEIRAP